MAHDSTETIGVEADSDLELLEFLEADLLPDGAQAGFKEQLRCYLRELLRERGTIASAVSEPPHRDPTRTSR